MPRCLSGQHSWRDEDFARRCCNGWTRVMVPAFYGQSLRGFPASYKVESSCRVWEPWLIPDSDQDEIKRILENTPESLLKPT